MDAVIATAMAKDPARRFASARELADAAAAALHDRGTVAGLHPAAGPHAIASGAAPNGPWWQHPDTPATVMAPAPVPARRPTRLLSAGRRRWVVAAAAAAVVVTAAATITAVTTTSQTETPTAEAPTTTVPSTTLVRPAPIVMPSDLHGLLPTLEDVKTFMGIEDLVAQQPTLQPSQNRNSPVDRKECWPLFAGGEPNSYDMKPVIGYYASTMAEPRNGPSLQNMGAVVVAFHDAAAAAQQLANSASTWRQCGGSSMTLLGSGASKPVQVAMSVPDIVENGITTMVLTVQGPVLRARDDRAIAAKNNVVVDVNVNMVNTDRGQQAALDITNYILGKITG